MSAAIERFSVSRKENDMSYLYTARMLILKVGVIFLSLLFSLSASAQIKQANQYRDTQILAETYLKSYINKDWNALEKLLGNDANFQDWTVQTISGAPVHQKGKVDMLKLFREQYADLSMKFEQQHAVFSTQHVSISGQLDLTMPVQGRQVRSVLPMTIILSIQNGLVVQHIDYVDYRPFILAQQASRTSSSTN
jgi:hypothetical protein